MLIANRSTVTTAIIAGLALVITACSSAKPGTAAPVTSAPVTSAPVTSAPVTSAPVTSAQSVTSPVETTASTQTVDTSQVSLPQVTIDTNAPDAKAAIALLDAALITADDLGTGFVAGSYDPADPTDTEATNPCGQILTAAMFPNSLRTGAVFNKGNVAQFEESVSLYLDADTARAAYDYASDGLSCGDASIGETKVTISKAQDVTDQVGGDQAQAWSVTIGSDTGVLVAVQVGALSIGYVFVAAAGTDLATLPEPLDIAAKATQKLIDSGI